MAHHVGSDSCCIRIGHRALAASSRPLRCPRPAPARPQPSRHRLASGEISEAFSCWREWTVVRALVRRILILFLIVSLVSALYTDLDYYLTPQISQGRYDRLIEAGEYLSAKGWKEPLPVLYGAPGTWVWSLYRTYLCGQVGETYNYYGNGQGPCYSAPP